MKAGDRGQDVKGLQVILNLIGYTIADSGPGSTGNETDFFGALTHEAVKRFQKENGVYPAVGYYGPITRGAIITYLLKSLGL